ncbi:DUF5677 domain-containing protein [Falsiroseomonas oryzae]|uniref:DUF5677 domain-containing protein n=1 Tax=Falsiroseomonas oryzae TaxID=2766473 RepID=UPI0022EB6297|nr:DUF5677 domain-containing protein [Roseomonas sp. MO-31]
MIETPRSDIHDAAAWHDVVERMIEAGAAVAAAAKVDSGNPAQITGLAALFRALQHIQGVRLLVKAGHVVEARIITRSLFEGMFMTADLAADGAAAFRALVDDHAASKRSRGEQIIQLNDTFSAAKADTAREHLRLLTAKIGKGRMMRPKEIAARTQMAGAYMFYSQLSNDSAHPSLNALERHVVRPEDGGLISEMTAAPQLDSAEDAETLGWACMAMLGTLVSVRDLTNAFAAEPTIAAASDAYMALTAAPGPVGEEE